MGKSQRESERYSLPFIVHSSYTFRTHVIFSFMTIMFLGFSFIPINEVVWIFIRILSLVLGLLLVYCWIYMGIMKKAFIELTEEGVLFRALMSKKIKWTDIIDVQTYCINNNFCIGIISKEKLKKRKNNFLTLLSDLLEGEYSLSISLNSFPTAEPEKLYSTIFYEVQENMQHESNEEEISEKEILNEMIEEEKAEKMIDGSPITAIFRALIISLISGTISGLLIYTLEVNLLIVPIFGIMGILYTYSKYYKEKGFNIIIRFLLGLVCAVQFFVAILVVSLMLNTKYIGIHGIWSAISNSTMNMAKYPEEYIRYYLYSIVSFFIGAFWGYSSKTTRKIQKIFMHKQNGFYIKREKRYVSIYLIDYAEYNENEEKTVLRINPNVCLIEKEKKKILSFYIPEQVVNDYNIDDNGLKRIFYHEEMYYRLDLGSHEKQQPYGYTSILILNKYNQVEVIQLEID